MKRLNKHGFTIVELLIVIVVIAVLAAVTIVAFNGLSQRARESQVQADLSGAVKQLKVYYAENSVYPTANTCPNPSSNQVCLKSSGGTTFVYAPNNSTSPPSFNLSASNSGVSYVASDTTNPSKSIGGNFVSLTNLATNGDFSAGSSGWTNHAIAPSTAVFSGGSVTITADATQRAVIYQPITATYTDNDKIFYSARVRRDSGSNFILQAQRDSGGFAVVVMPAAQFNAIGVGTFSRQSGIRTFLSSQGTFTSYTFGEYATGRVFQATIDDVVVINLTAAFGAGNEPTVATMDSILGQFTNGYFSGTVTASY